MRCSKTLDLSVNLLMCTQLPDANLSIWIAYIPTAYFIV